MRDNDTRNKSKVSKTITMKIYSQKKRSRSEMEGTKSLSGF